MNSLSAREKVGEVLAHLDHVVFRADLGLQGTALDVGELGGERVVLDLDTVGRRRLHERKHDRRKDRAPTREKPWKYLSKGRGMFMCGCCGFLELQVREIRVHEGSAWKVAVVGAKGVRGWAGRR